MARTHVFLIIVALLACAVLITINHYSSRINSSIRAYVAGESYYSKGQKDASRQLAFYLLSGDERHYELFKEYLQIPLGDSIARVNLQNGGHIDTVRAGFLQGMNHPDDVDDLIWLFKNFQHLSFMSKAIDIWRDADGLIAELNQLGKLINVHNQNIYASNYEDKNGLRQAAEEVWLLEIEELTNSLTAKEREFSRHMGETARYIGGILYFFNILFILLTIGSATLLFIRLLRGMQESKNQLIIKNENLRDLNHRLDHFIYASSHDLKAPINNMEGLMGMIDKSSLPKGDLILLEKMSFVMANLKQTIHDIEALIKTDRLGQGDKEEIDLRSLIKQIITENEFGIEQSNADIKMELEAERLIYPKIAMKSILQNLISNALKYRSPDRNCQIRIKSWQEGEHSFISVSDNGIGLDLSKSGEKLFGMFKRFHSHVPGSGLGLYAVKQAIERNGGSISVSSEVQKGTTFVIKL